MGKILLTLLLTIAILIPTMELAEAADIPDVRQISSAIIPDTSVFDKDYSVYVYECRNGGKYAAQFVQMLTRNYQFKIIFSDTADEYPEWALIYTGTKKVAFSNKLGKCHVLISGSKDDIDIRIVKGLSYAGHFKKDYMGNFVEGH